MSSDITRPAIKLPFGLNAQRILVHVREVESGKACACCCPSCGSPLVAAKGAIKQHHFKHATNVECEGGLESAIHLAAKQLIRRKKRITLPLHKLVETAPDSTGLQHVVSETLVDDNTVIEFDRVDEEVAVGAMKVDLLATKGGKQLLIEIFFRHKVDEEKASRIETANISAIEIDLSDLHPEHVCDWDALWSSMNQVHRIEWLYHAKTSQARERLRRRLTRSIAAAEAKYREQKLVEARKQQRERHRLVKAVADVCALSSRESIEKIQLEAENHPAWAYNRQYVPYSLSDAPAVVNVQVPNGDWIFGCDRRVWQTAVVSYFICKNRKPFCIRSVDKWLQSTVGCKVANCTTIVSMYAWRYPDVLPIEMRGNTPSSWRTLTAYFYVLSEHGVVECSGQDRAGNLWFRVAGPGGM